MPITSSLPPVAITDWRRVEMLTTIADAMTVAFRSRCASLPSLPCELFDADVTDLCHDADRLLSTAASLEGLIQQPGEGGGAVGRPDVLIATGGIDATVERAKSLSAAVGVALTRLRNACRAALPASGSRPPPARVDGRATMPQSQSSNSDVEGRDRVAVTATRWAAAVPKRASEPRSASGQRIDPSDRQAVERRRGLEEATGAIDAALSALSELTVWAALLGDIRGAMTARDGHSARALLHRAKASARAAEGRVPPSSIPTALLRWVEDVWLPGIDAYDRMKQVVALAVADSRGRADGGERPLPEIHDLRQRLEELRLKATNQQAMLQSSVGKMPADDDELLKPLADEIRRREQLDVARDNVRRCIAAVNFAQLPRHLGLLRSLSESGAETTHRSDLELIREAERMIVHVQRAAQCTTTMTLALKASDLQTVIRAVHTANELIRDANLHTEDGNGGSLDLALRLGADFIAFPEWFVVRDDTPLHASTVEEHAAPQIATTAPVIVWQNNLDVASTRDDTASLIGTGQASLPAMSHSDDGKRTISAIQSRLRRLMVAHVPSGAWSPEMTEVYMKLGQRAAHLLNTMWLLGQLRAAAAVIRRIDSDQAALPASSAMDWTARLASWRQLLREATEGALICNEHTLTLQSFLEQYQSALLKIHFEENTRLAEVRDGRANWPAVASAVYACVLEHYPPSTARRLLPTLRIRFRDPAGDLITIVTAKDWEMAQQVVLQQQAPFGGSRRGHTSEGVLLPMGHGASSSAAALACHKQLHMTLYVDRPPAIALAEQMFAEEAAAREQQQQQAQQRQSLAAPVSGSSRMRQASSSTAAGGAKRRPPAVHHVASRKGGTTTPAASSTDYSVGPPATPPQALDDCRLEYRQRRARDLADLRADRRVGDTMRLAELTSMQDRLWGADSGEGAGGEHPASRWHVPASADITLPSMATIASVAATSLPPSPEPSPPRRTDHRDGGGGGGKGGWDAPDDDLHLRTMMSVSTASVVSGGHPLPLRGPPPPLPQPQPVTSPAPPSVGRQVGGSSTSQRPPAPSGGWRIREAVAPRRNPLLAAVSGSGGPPDAMGPNDPRHDLTLLSLQGKSIASAPPVMAHR